MSQNQSILEHLQAGNTISPMEALKLFNCWALSSRISDLHKEGYNIKSKNEHGDNGKTYARYYLVSETETALSDNFQKREESVNRQAFETLTGQKAFCL